MENNNQIEKAQKLAENIGNDIRQGRKPTIINKYVKNFFFVTLRGRKDIKGIESMIGKLQFISLMFVPGKSILRCQSKTSHEDIDLTDEEVKQIFKNFSVKQESVDACKSIFANLNFDTKCVVIQQNRKDGTTNTITI